MSIPASSFPVNGPWPVEGVIEPYGIPEEPESDITEAYNVIAPLLEKYGIVSEANVHTLLDDPSTDANELKRRIREDLERRRIFASNEAEVLRDKIAKLETEAWALKTIASEVWGSTTYMRYMFGNEPVPFSF